MLLKPEVTLHPQSRDSERYMVVIHFLLFIQTEILAPGEWSCSQWAGLPTSVNLVKITPPPRWGSLEPVRLIILTTLDFQTKTSVAVIGSPYWCVVCTRLQMLGLER